MAVLAGQKSVGLSKAMKPIIVFPVPLENEVARDEFRPYVKRFCDSLRQFDPGCEYELAVIFNGGDVDAITETMKTFVDLPFKFDPQGRFLDLEQVKFYRYRGTGCDIGSFLWFSKRKNENVFLVCCNTRVYAHRAGWLKEMMLARGTFGPGLYATAISKESGALHVCCRCFGMDSEDLANYPHSIDSREKGQFFENGAGNLYAWCNQEMMMCYLVTFNEVANISTDPSDPCWTASDIYRKGDQSNMLVHDRHSNIYHNASPEEKERLARMCFEGVP